MYAEPQQPGEEARGFDGPYGGDRLEARYGRQRAPVVVLERPPRVVPVESAHDRSRSVPARLDRNLRQPRKPIQAHQVANHEDLWMSWNCAVRQNWHASGTVTLRARRIGDEASQRRGLHASRPDLGGRFESLVSRVFRTGVDTVLIDTGDHGSEADLHTHAFEHQRRPPL